MVYKLSKGFINLMSPFRSLNILQTIISLLNIIYLIIFNLLKNGLKIEMYFKFFLQNRIFNSH